MAFLDPEPERKYSEPEPQLNEIFLREIDPVFKSIGMCCGKRYRFRARALACYAMPANGCHVARDKPYYLYNDRYVSYYTIPLNLSLTHFFFQFFENLNFRKAFLIELSTLSLHRYSVCVECYIKAKDECPGPFHLKFITIFKNQSDPKAINDTTNHLLEEFRFVEKNSHEEPEPYLTCAGACKRAFHRICVNHPDGVYDSPLVLPVFTEFSRFIIFSRFIDFPAEFSRFIDFKHLLSPSQVHL